MRLARNTEWAVVGALIVYTVFFPSFPIVRQIVSSPVGTALSIAGVYYVAKCISIPLAFVVLVALIRSSSAVTREHMASSVDCHCAEAGYTFDSASRQCKTTDKDDAGNVKKEMAPLCCTPMQMWDAAKKECKTKPGPAGSLMAAAGGGSPSGPTPPKM